MSRRLSGSSTLGRLEEQHLLLHNGIVLEHAERAVCPGSNHRSKEAGHGHGNQANRNGTGLSCRCDRMLAPSAVNAARLDGPGLGTRLGCEDEFKKSAPAIDGIERTFLCCHFGGSS